MVSIFAMMARWPLVQRRRSPPENLLRRKLAVGFSPRNPLPMRGKGMLGESDEKYPFRETPYRPARAALDALSMSPREIAGLDLR